MARMRSPLHLAGNEASGFKNLDMFRCRSQRHLEGFGQLGYGSLALGKTSQHLPSRGIAESVENGVKFGCKIFNHVVEYSDSRKLVNYLVEYFLSLRSVKQVRWKSDVHTSSPNPPFAMPQDHRHDQIFLIREMPVDETLELQQMRMESPCLATLQHAIGVTHESGNMRVERLMI